MAKRESNNKANYSSLAGEFAVLSQLNLREFDASLTLGNTKGIDILVSDPKSGRQKRIEVKTKIGGTKSGILRRRHFGEFLCEWQMGEKHEEIIDPNLLYCFVHFSSNADSSPRFYVVPSEVVATYVKKQHAHWGKQLNLKGEQYSETPMRMFRIGLEDHEYTIHPTPLSTEYLGRWDLI